LAARTKRRGRRSAVRSRIIVTANPDAAAFEYTIIWPDDLYHHGKTKAATVCVGNIHRAEAIQAARSHVAQAAWNPYCKDDQFIGQTGLETAGPATSLIGSAGSADIRRSSQPERATKKPSTSRAAEPRSPGPRMWTALRLLLKCQ
jgi:hypothetical protein